MGRFILVPVGEHAKQHCADGLPLWTNKPVVLGRGVRPSDGYKYPNEWNSLSTRHCQLSFAAEAQGPGHFLVTDTSTNGTYVYDNLEQKVKIGKNNTKELRVGQYLGLSVVPPPANATLQFINTVEYRLDYEEHALPAAPPMAGTTASTPAAPVSANKRKQVGSPVPAAAAGAPAVVDGEAGSAKRQRQETPELLLMRQKNEELRAKVAECHKQIGELDQQLRDKEESHAAEVEERRRELQDLQERLTIAAKNELELKTQLDTAKTQLVQREEALTSTSNELEVKAQLIRELETAAALIQSELQEKAAVASAAADTIAGLQQQLVAAQEEAVDAVQQLQKQQHTATVALEEARTRAAEAEKERRTAAAQLRAAHSERALLRDKVESEQELLNVFSNQTEMVLNEAAAKQAELSAQAQTITNIMNQLIAGHANFSKHLGSKQSELKTLLEPGALAAAAAAEATTATAAGGASSMGSLEDLQQYKQRQLLQGALHDAGHVSGSQVTTGHNSEVDGAAAGVAAIAGQATVAVGAELGDQQQQQQQQTPLSFNKTQLAAATPATAVAQYDQDMFDEATQDNNDFPSTMEYHVPNNLLGTLVAADEVQAAVGHGVAPQGAVSGQQQQQAGAVGDHDRGAQQGAAHASGGGADVSASQEQRQVSAPEVNADEDEDDDEMVDADQERGGPEGPGKGSTADGGLRVVAASEEDTAPAAGVTTGATGALAFASVDQAGGGCGRPNEEQQEQQQQQADTEDEFDDLDGDDGTDSPERKPAEGGGAREPAALAAAPGLAAGQCAAGDNALKQKAEEEEELEVEEAAEAEGDQEDEEKVEEAEEGALEEAEEGALEEAEEGALEAPHCHQQQQHHQQQHDLLGLLPGRVDAHGSNLDQDASAAAAAAAGGGGVPGEKVAIKAMQGRHLLGSAAPAASSPAEPCSQPKGALADIGNHVGITPGKGGEGRQHHQQQQQQQRWWAGGGGDLGSGYEDGY